PRAEIDRTAAENLDNRIGEAEILVAHFAVGKREAAAQHTECHRRGISERRIELAQMHRTAREFEIGAANRAIGDGHVTMAPEIAHYRRHALSARGGIKREFARSIDAGDAEHV